MRKNKGAIIKMSVNSNPTISDRFGRQFSYLRLSITDACNFRCGYCLPEGYQKSFGTPEPLTVPEILRLVRAFVEMGTQKVRLTGGEPTLRRDLLEIAREISKLDGINQLALSTNGYRLRELARPLLEAGVQYLNVSVDTLNVQKFQETTGKNILPSILSGIDHSLQLSFKKIKINAVLLAGTNDSDESLEEFQQWIQTRPVAVRFIELMPNSSIPSFFSKHHTQSQTLRNKLLKQGWVVRAREFNDGPAEEYSHPNYLGKMGIIAPYREHFCSTCNRLRVTSYGQLRLCLFAEGEQSLRPWLQHEDQKEELKARLIELVGKKEISHYLPEGKYGNNKTFSAIGG
jgi:cyclic pyranopterin phosphate synthase